MLLRNLTYKVYWPPVLGENTGLFRAATRRSYFLSG
jgi:hypothetical protein